MYILIILLIVIIVIIIDINVIIIVIMTRRSIRVATQGGAGKRHNTTIRNYKSIKLNKTITHNKHIIAT